MKRTILFLFSFVSILSALIAAPIERAVALQYARQFLSQTSVPQFTRSSVSEVEPEPAYVAKDAMTGTSHFYVYNFSNDGGFVIVAAETRARTILGYSFNGSFDKENIPVNMREWLDEYSSQIAYAIKQLPETATTPVVTRGTSVNTIVVDPLLGEIAYKQNAPYNDLCPMEGDTRSVTGCVATAMAQIMRYYQHPVQGVGTKNYTPPRIGYELYVNFGATTYDWTNMLPKYNASATEEQKVAVATLMYHAGVAVKMDYSATGSEASTADGALALYEHFNYDIGVNAALRQYYSEEEWLQLIKTELNADRPVLMRGQGNAGGHAFVCDGYGTNDFVHINWGWGEPFNGYFQISALNLEGIGDFNLNQAVYYGIQKPQSGSVANIVLGVEEIGVDKSSISGGETAQFNLLKVMLASLFPFDGQLALALYDNEGNFVKTIRSYSNIELRQGEYFPLLPFANIGISDIRPNESTTGTFFIRPVYKPQGEDTWKPMLVENGKVSEIPAVITDSEISFTIPEIVYLIEVSANPIEGGTVTGGGSFAHGSSQTVTATANIGYTFTNWTENGTVVSTESNYMFTVEQERSLVANFVVSQYTVTFVTPTNGSLNVFYGESEIESGTQVEHGTSLRVVALPDVGYNLVSLKANGEAVANDTVTVTGPTEIAAVFGKQQFPVDFTQPSNGTLRVFRGSTEIEPGAQVEHGTQLRVEAAPDAGYKLLSLQANGDAVSNDTVTVTGATEIAAVFGKQQFPVDFTQPSNGTLRVFRGSTEIEPGAQVEHGTQLRVEAVPDAGYKLLSLKANGEAIANDTVTVTAPTEIVALFERLVSTDNYRIKVTNAGCPGSNDGKIEVSFAKQFDYTVIVKNNSGFEKVDRVTGTLYSLTDLVAGNYSVCFTIEGATNYKQCFEVVISQPQDLSVFKSGVGDNHATYLLNGGTRYTVTYNGRSVETTDDVIRVPLRRGRNVIRITAENECQGVFEDEVYHNDINKLIPFPNPTTGYFSIILPHGEEEVTVEIISILGHSVLKEKRRVSQNGLISLNISTLPKGIYLVRVSGKTVKSVTKVIKK